jgi:hypothetical protein
MGNRIHTGQPVSQQPFLFFPSCEIAQSLYLQKHPMTSFISSALLKKKKKKKNQDPVPCCTLR